MITDLSGYWKTAQKFEGPFSFLNAVAGCHREEDAIKEVLLCHLILALTSAFTLAAVRQEV